MSPTLSVLDVIVKRIFTVARILSPRRELPGAIQAVRSRLGPALQCPIHRARRTTIEQTLNEDTADPDPFRQFAAWYGATRAAGLLEPEAMVLATSTRGGRPAARMVLLKAFDDRGLVFYTNSSSRKGQELAENPWASLVFFWPALYRQIRIEGRVEEVTPQESDAYFATRPRGSQIAALASHQSEVLPDRRALEERFDALARAYEDAPVPRPEYWGGYRVVPDCFEFWQGRRDRLHDRLRYSRRPDGSWLVERLSP